MTLYIAHAQLITPTRVIPDGALIAHGAHIVSAGSAGDITRPADAESIDAAGMFLAPGFVDLQINGAFGQDFTTKPAAMWEVGAGLPRYGVTSFLPTIVSSPLHTVAAAQETLLAGPPAGYQGGMPLGLHVEGPFLNPARRGAHNPNHLRLPDVAATADWSADLGVRLVTLAPELPGALELVRALAARGIVVGAAHSTATYEEAQAAIAAGITYGTHLFNTMPPLNHRAPGLAGALLHDPRITVGMIADGIHLHPATVALTWRAKGPHRVSLVTDAMAALGMPPGHYAMSDDDVIGDGTSARLADGRLAGSLLSLDQAVRNLIAYTGCSLAEAISTVTINAARLLGLSGRLGQIAPGCVADFALLTADLQVAMTVAGGRVVYSTMTG